ncbi:hypothetical protein N7462_009978 [Penicillium macrosclerotiorum]|uniref:uncharacterized protein n=1 Tax=Penicillium macrosclerotiorum TaxID=303699 RepID=UPI002547ED13|nr:uncharacterized protein N7462_009978 [Penicillium macrosclerotiorum]KAJ5668908.1 hypothetical protein N7462_009978 [Penicillium macrosclerotiorum]
MVATISELLHSCLAQFNRLVSTPELFSLSPEVSLQDWKDELGRLRVWAANIGAHQNLQSSLDYRLRDATHIKDQILRLLEQVQELLLDAQEVLGEDTRDENEDVGFEYQPEEFAENLEDTTEVQEIHQTLADTITQLHRMTMLIRSPAQHDRLVGTKKLDSEPFKFWTRQHVSSKYPNADEAVVNRISSAMAKQRAILKYRERHHIKLSRGIDIDDVDGKSTILSDTIVSNVYKESSNELSDIASEAHASETSYGGTLLEGKDTEAPKIPPIPKQGRDQRPFECPFCFYIITVRDIKSWAHHIFKDLMPYVCPFLDCSIPNKLYDSRRQWFHHIQQFHFSAASTNSYDCFICKEISLPAVTFQRHVGQHLEELSLFLLPRTDTEEFENAASDNERHENFHNIETMSAASSASLDHGPGPSYFPSEQPTNVEDSSFRERYDFSEDLQTAMGAPPSLYARSKTSKVEEKSKSQNLEVKTDGEPHIAEFDHLLSHSLASAQNEFICTVCNMSFLWRFEHDSHMYSREHILNEKNIRPLDKQYQDLNSNHETIAAGKRRSSNMPPESGGNERPLSGQTKKERLSLTGNLREAFGWDQEVDSSLEQDSEGESRRSRFDRPTHSPLARPRVVYNDSQFNQQTRKTPFYARRLSMENLEEYYGMEAIEADSEGESRIPRFDRPRTSLRVRERHPYNDQQFGGQIGRAVDPMKTRRWSESTEDILHEPSIDEQLNPSPELVEQDSEDELRRSRFDRPTTSRLARYRAVYNDSQFNQQTRKESFPTRRLSTGNKYMQDLQASSREARTSRFDLPATSSRVRGRNSYNDQQSSGQTGELVNLMHIKRPPRFRPPRETIDERLESGPVSLEQDLGGEPRRSRFDRPTTSRLARYRAVYNDSQFNQQTRKESFPTRRLSTGNVQADEDMPAIEADFEGGSRISRFDRPATADRGRGTNLDDGQQFGSQIGEAVDIIQLKRRPQNGPPRKTIDEWLESGPEQLSDPQQLDHLGLRTPKVNLTPRIDLGPKTRDDFYNMVSSHQTAESDPTRGRGATGEPSGSKS